MCCGLDVFNIERKFPPENSLVDDLTKEMLDDVVGQGIFVVPGRSQVFGAERA